MCIPFAQFNHTHYFLKPPPAEILNGSALEDDLDDEVRSVPNGTQRSISSSLPRSRTPISGSSATIISTQPHRLHHHHHHLSQSSTAPQPIPAQAKETFLNYFFGGQGPVSAPSSMRGTPPPLPPRGSKSAAAGVAGDVDDLLDQDAGKSAAMDMKSLGKHIDAVRPFFFTSSGQLVN